MQGLLGLSLPIFLKSYSSLDLLDHSFHSVILHTMITRARILMQKHIFSMWAESKDASKSEEFSMKGVSMQKL